MPQDARSRLWVLVTDGHRARIVVPDETEGRFRTLLPLGVGEAPHYPPSLPHAAARAPLDQFAADVASRLNQAADEDEFDELIIVAPIPVAHAIRTALNAHATARLMGTLSRDYTALDDGGLSTHLARWWLPPSGGNDIAAMFVPEAPAA